MAVAILLPLTAQASTLNQRATDWSLMPRVSKLNTEHRTTLFQVFKEEPDYSPCEYSVLDCVQRDSPDATAIRMMNFGAYLVFLPINCEPFSESEPNSEVPKQCNHSLSKKPRLWAKMRPESQ